MSIVNYDQNLPVNVRLNAPEERLDLGRSLAVQGKTPAPAPTGLAHPGLEEGLAVLAEHSPALGEPKDG